MSCGGGDRAEGGGGEWVCFGGGGEGGDPVTASAAGHGWVRTGDLEELFNEKELKV